MPCPCCNPCSGLCSTSADCSEGCECVDGQCVNTQSNDCTKYCKIKIIGSYTYGDPTPSGQGVFSVITYCDTFRAVAWMARADGHGCAAGCESDEAIANAIDAFTSVYGGTVTVTCGSPDTSCGCGCRYGGGWTCYWPILDQVPDGFNTFCESDEVEKCGLTQGKHVVEYHWLMNVGALGDVQSWSRNAFEGASSRAMYGPSGCPELQTNRVFCSDGYSDSQWANYDKVLDYYEAGTPVVLYNKTSTTYESVITDDCYCGWSSSSTVEKFSAWIKDCTTGQMKDITGEIMLRDTVKYCAIPSGQCLDGRENPLGFIFTNSKASSSPYCVTNPLP